MWANAQRDGRPAEYRWRPLVNAAKFANTGVRCSNATKLCDGVQMAIFDDFLRPVFAASAVQHVSDLQLKFALRPHHVSKYGRHPICDG